MMLIKTKQIIVIIIFLVKYSKIKIYNVSYPNDITWGINGEFLKSKTVYAK